MYLTGQPEDPTHLLRSNQESNSPIYRTNLQLNPQTYAFVDSFGNIFMPESASSSCLLPFDDLSMTPVSVERCPSIAPSDEPEQLSPYNSPSSPIDLDLAQPWHGASELQTAYDDLRRCPELLHQERVPDHYVTPFLNRVPFPPQSTGKGSREGAMQYKCRWPECYKSFTRADHGRDHIRGHVNSKPYKCDHW